MKFFLSNALFSITTVVLPFSFVLNDIPEDPPTGKDTQQIKVIKIDSEGNKTELDTIIKGDNIFVWNGDTIGNFEMPDLSKLDSLSKNFTFHFSKDDIDFEPPFVMPPYAPKPPKGPHVFHIKKKTSENIIDLSDPGIISYKKKSISKGREKITIIREEKEENENDEVDGSWSVSPSEFIMKKPHEIEKRIKIIKNDDGEIEVFEDEDVKINSDGESVRVMEEDGKVIIIKEKKNKGETEIEVEVEVNEKETENSQENN